jgi:hypothetical protein
VTFVDEAELAQTELGAKHAGHRSTDELALLYINSVVYGVGTGAYTAILAEAGSSAGVVLPMLGFSGAGVLTIALVDHHSQFRYGVPQSMITGMYLGAAQGTLWMSYAATTGYIDPKPAATIVWGSATVGVIAGGLLAHNLGSTPGRSSWVGSTALWTGSISALTAGAISEDGSHVLLGGALGHGAGAFIGLATAGEFAPSIARVRYIDLGGLSGALLGGGLYFALSGDSFEGKAMAITTALGVGTGVGLGAYFTRKMKKDELSPSRASVSTGLASVRLHPLSLPGGGGVGAVGVW